MKNKAIFLDRDGVLNQSVVRNGKPFPPNSLDTLVIPEGVHEALSSLRTAGFLLIGITNQPDVKRGKTSKETVVKINQYLSAHLNIDEFFVCFHDDIDNCECRKPKPGLIQQAASKYNIDSLKSFMIGDRWKDIDAGYLAKCKTILIDNNYLEKSPHNFPNFITNSLIDAAKWILSH